MTDDVDFDLDLEARLRAHYGVVDPGPAPQSWARNIERVLDRRPRRSSPGRRWLLGAAAAALVALGCLGGLQLLGRQASTSGPSPSAGISSAVPSPSDAETQSPVAQILVEHAGSFAPHGVWAIRAGQLFVSSDAGGTWTEGRAPNEVVASNGNGVYEATMLDADIGFVVASGPATTAFNGNSTDLQPLVVYRTADGGQTWRSTELGGNFPGVTASITFVDSMRGFIFLAPFHPSATQATLFATTDGGITWVLVGSNATWKLQPAPGGQFAAAQADILVTGASADAAVTDHTLLAASSDGGATWKALDLPGLEGRVGGNDAIFPAPPTLDSTGGGAAAVVNRLPSGMRTEIFRASRLGLDWTAVGSLPMQAATGVVMLDNRHWLIAGEDPADLFASADAGATWQRVAAQGLPSTGAVMAAGAIDATHAWMRAVDAALGPVLLITDDSGLTWHRVTFGPLPALTPAPAEPSPTPEQIESPTVSPAPTPSSAAHRPPDSWGTLSIGPLSPGPSGTTHVTSWADGFFAATTGGNGWLSHDGRVWWPMPDSTFGDAQELEAVPYQSGLLVFAGGSANGDATWRTADGTTWSRLPIEPISFQVGGVASDGTVVVAIRNDGIPGLLFSDDGKGWNPATTDDGSAFFPTSVIFRIDAQFTGFVAVGSTSTGRAVAWTSEDGRTWSSAVVKGGAAADGVALSSLVSGRDGLVTLGFTGGTPGQSSYWVGTISGDPGKGQVTFAPSAAAPLGTDGGGAAWAGPLGQFSGDGTWILAWGAGANAAESQLWTSRDGTTWQQVKLQGGGDGNADVGGRAFAVGDAVLFATRDGTPDWMGDMAGPG